MSHLSRKLSNQSVLHKERIKYLYHVDREHRGGRPDVVGVGFQKAGTSSVMLFLREAGLQPPRGRVLAQKELHWFGVFGTRGRFERLTYRAQFPPSGVSGEFTPNYAERPVALHNLRQAAPAAKAIVFMRDPVARFVSSVEHARSLGAIPSGWKAEQIWHAAWNGEGDGWIASAVRRGTYVNDVETVYSVFGKDNVFTGFFEDWIDPSRSVDLRANLVAFCNVVADREKLPTIKRTNSSLAKLGRTGLTAVDWPPEILTELRDYYSDYRKPLQELVGRISW